MIVRPVVYRQGPRARGDIYLGTRPKPGNVLDAEGRLILVHEYGPDPQKVQVDGLGPLSQGDKLQVAAPIRRINRGVAQPDLL